MRERVRVQERERERESAVPRLAAIFAPPPKAAAVAAGAFKSKKVELAALAKSFADGGAEARGRMEPHTAFELRKTLAEGEVTQRWAQGRKGAQVLPDQVLQDSVQDALQKEMTAYDAMRKGWKKGQFGDIFAPYGTGAEKVEERPERYEFWVTVRDQLPLLYFLARCVLCTPATSTANESLHSVAAYILRKQRASMKAPNAEAYTLAAVLLPDYIRTNPQLAAMQEDADDAGCVDAESLDALLA